MNFLALIRHLSTGALALAFLCVLQIVASAAAPARPNIVFIFSDDHAYQAISAMAIRATCLHAKIDRLATEGMRFYRCLVPNSICGPSRAPSSPANTTTSTAFTTIPTAASTARNRPFPKLLQRPATRPPSSANGT